MNIHQLETFVKLGETLNFNKTARQLFMSQPAVTKHIKQLEEELGVILFE